MHPRCLQDTHEIPKTAPDPPRFAQKPPDYLQTTLRRPKAPTYPKILAHIPMAKARWRNGEALRYIYIYIHIHIHIYCTYTQTHAHTHVHAHARGEPSKVPGEPLQHNRGTARARNNNEYLIRDSENPFRQAWLGNKHLVEYCILDYMAYTYGLH